MTPIDESMLERVIRNVCENMLGMTLWHARNLAGDEKRLIATVQISGNCVVRVDVETVRDVVRLVAARMFSLPVEELTESDLRDALGEVANMIGGNVKGILPGENELSLPVVEDRTKRGVEIPSYAGGSSTVTCRMSSDGSPLVVRLTSPKKYDSTGDDDFAETAMFAG